ncbi:MAG: hypothetical protein MRY83_03195 [Flavobacteriales bacterium]|nr:hypothetical protein [Flavobacteriales bacterium]
MRSFFIVLLCLCFQYSWSQSITITGNVKSSESGFDLLNLMVVNKNTGVGVFGTHKGEFNIKVDKNDSIMISSTGYLTKTISFRDSTFNTHYDITVYLKKLQIQLREVQIFPQRELDEIYREIDELGYNKNDYMVSGLDALNSPITFLYQSFSKRERRRRRAEEIINEENRRELLRELLSRYAHSNIINLKNEEFDKFIDYCRISDYQLQNSTQYDFILFVKNRYEAYMNEYDW